MANRPAVSIRQGGNDAQVNPLGGGLVQCDSCLHQGSLGRQYQAHFVSVTAAATIDLCIHTGPNTYGYHMSFDALIDGAAELWLVERPEVSATGTEIPLICTERTNPRAPESEVFRGGTYAATTLTVTLLHEAVYAEGPFAQGGNVGSHGWFLAPAFDYLLRFVGDAAALASVEIQLAELPV